MDDELEQAIQRDIDGLPERFRGSGLAALALSMARKIDSGRGSPSECAKALMQAMGELRSLAPPVREKDGLDDITTQRIKRRKRGAGA